MQLDPERHHPAIPPNSTRIEKEGNDVGNGETEPRKSGTGARHAHSKSQPEAKEGMTIPTRASRG